MDSKREVVLEVKDSSQATAIVNKEDEISEPEEDSLAGQMNALKTGLAAPPKHTKKHAPDEESSDEESDTEGEADETSETDTVTDSEDEGKVKKK